jgi:hypothetical protein
MDLYRNDILPHSVPVKVSVESRMAVVLEKRAVRVVHMDMVKVTTYYGGVVPACLPSRAYDILSRKKNR